MEAAVQVGVNEWTKAFNRHVEPQRAIHMMAINNSFLAFGLLGDIKVIWRAVRPIGLQILSKQDTRYRLPDFWTSSNFMMSLIVLEHKQELWIKESLEVVF